MRLLIFFLLQANLLLGHGALDEQIAEISAKITETPDNPQLWLDRADLHKSHRDPAAALNDFNQATQIKPPFPPAFLKLARFHRKAGQPTLASQALATYFKIEQAPTPLAFREKALLSSPADALPHWQIYLKNAAAPVMHDYQLAASAALAADDKETLLKFLTAGLDHSPKSIQLHQLRAQALLSQQDIDGAEKVFQTLSLLYPNLLVKLKYEEALIWEKHHHQAHSSQALAAGLKAYQQLPSRLQKNQDLQTLASKIQASLCK